MSRVSCIIPNCQSTWRGNRTHNLTWNKNRICDWCKPRRVSKYGNGRGCSSLTKGKEVLLAKAIELSVRFSLGFNRSLAEFPFYYVSLNAGSAINDCGAPCDSINFLRICKKYNRKYRAYLCEASLDYMFDLYDYIRNELNIYADSDGGADWICYYSDSSVFKNSPDQEYTRDNSMLLPIVWNDIVRLGERHRYAVGCIVSDANGPGAGGSPSGHMQISRRKCPRLDQIININFGNMNAWGKAETTIGRRVVTSNWEFRSVREMLCEYFYGTKWLVSDIAGQPNNPRSRYIIAVGRESYPVHLPYSDFYKLDSKRGRSILAETDPK